MRRSQKWLLIFTSSLILLTYACFFYFMATKQLRSDFFAFYSSSLAYFSGKQPYTLIFAEYLPHPVTLNVNLNPPFFLHLIQPLGWLAAHKALVVWTAISLGLGLVGARITSLVSLPKPYLKKHGLLILCLYLTAYPTLMNTSIGQVGNILLFFIIAGYYSYLKKLDILAGLLWGLIVAIKLFPALLFFFILQQKRYLVGSIMSLVIAFAWSLPLLNYGWKIYSLYFAPLNHLFWCGDNWNASLYGFIFRVLAIPSNKDPSLLLVKGFYLFGFVIGLGWYLKQIFAKEKMSLPEPLIESRERNYKFCLTLCMMLFLSPLGWLYYFPLLFMPLILLWRGFANQENFSTKDLMLWTLCLFLINFPLGYIQGQVSDGLILKLSLYSIHFYGLILLIYLLKRQYLPPKPFKLDSMASLENSMIISPRLNYTNAKALAAPTFFILGYGLFIMAFAFFNHVLTLKNAAS